MLDKLRALLAEAAPAQAPDPRAAQRRAVAGLLVEIARADHEEKPGELAAIQGIVGRFFGVDAATAAELLEEARTAVEGSTSLREFTAPLHRDMSYEERQAVIALLWDVALQDRDLDKYEDYLVGKIAELLYVARGDVVRLRYQASQRREAAVTRPAD
jgi:uncharacterized tellurite resistance protein B-like protein